MLHRVSRRHLEGSGRMHFSWVVRVSLVLTINFLFTARSDAQAGATPRQRIEAVHDHLTRYVVLKNSDHRYMQLAAQMESLHVPAVSMAAIRDGRIDWVEAYGVASLGGPKATTRTLFGAASMSKPLTAVGVLKLVEDGKIDLDANVNQYLKRWKIPQSAFTIEKMV